MSKTINKLVSLAATLGVAVSLCLVANTAHAGENPVPTYQISPTGQGESLNIRLHGAWAVQTGSQVVVVGSDEKVLETLPESVALSTGQIVRASYDVSDPHNVRVSLVYQVTNSDVAAEGLVRRSVRSVSWGCVFSAGVGGAIGGAIVGAIGGPGTALGIAAVVMIGSGITSIFSTCNGNPRVH